MLWLFSIVWSGFIKKANAVHLFNAQDIDFSLDTNLHLSQLISFSVENYYREFLKATVKQGGIMSIYKMINYLDFSWPVSFAKLCSFWPGFPIQGFTGFPIQGFHVQNHWVAPRLTQPSILLRSIKWVPRISGILVVKSRLPPLSGSSLEGVEHHP